MGKREEKDFRNVTLTQLDRGQVIKGSFSELNSGLRSIPTNSIISDTYTHFIQTVNASGQPLTVDYYQATRTAIDKVTCVADVAQSLSGKFIILEEFITKKQYLFYFVVSGAGVAPGVADHETAVIINTNDSANLVAFALSVAMNTVDDIIVKQSSLLSPDVTFEYLEFGETSAVNLGTTGFLVTREQEGNSKKVGSLTLTYNAEGDPVYNGNTMNGMLYNTYTGSFDVNSSTSDITKNTNPFNDVEYGLTNVSTTATLLSVGASNKTGRRSITIQPKGKTIFYGFDNTVTAGNSGTGFKLTSNSFVTISLGPDEDLYAITSNGTAKVTVSEMK